MGGSEGSRVVAVGVDNRVDGWVIFEKVNVVRQVNAGLSLVCGSFTGFEIDLDHVGGDHGVVVHSARLNVQLAGVTVEATYVAAVHCH